MNKSQLEVFLEILEQGGAEATTFKANDKEIKVYNSSSEFVTFSFNEDGSIFSID